MLFIVALMLIDFTKADDYSYASYDYDDYYEYGIDYADDPAKTTCDPSATEKKNLLRENFIIHHSSINIVCKNGCLKIEKAVLTCSPSKLKDLKKHTAMAQKKCGDGTKKNKKSSCTLDACPSSWKKKMKKCQRPVLMVTYSCLGAKAEGSYNLQRQICNSKKAVGSSKPTVKGKGHDYSDFALEYGFDYSDYKASEKTCSKDESKTMEVSSYLSTALTMECQNGCLRIDKAIFTCSESDKSDLKKHTQLAKKLCGDGSKHAETKECTLTSCPSFWGKQKMGCKDPVLLVTYGCNGPAMKLNHSFRHIGKCAKKEKLKQRKQIRIGDYQGNGISCKPESGRQKISTSTLHGQSLTLTCDQGCLRIDEAHFSCDEGDHERDLSKDTELAMSLCGDGTVAEARKQCTLKACPSFWNKNNLTCKDPIQHVKYSCIGENAKDKQFYNTEGSCEALAKGSIGSPKESLPQDNLIKDHFQHLEEEYGYDYSDSNVGGNNCEGVKTDPSSKINLSQSDAKIQVTCNNGCLKIHKAWLGCPGAIEDPHHMKEDTIIAQNHCWGAAQGANKNAKCMLTACPANWYPRDINCPKPILHLSYSCIGNGATESTQEFPANCEKELY